MHVYRLENKVQDKAFLAGNHVTCRAVMEEKSEKLNNGDFILVQLSTGKKYKGKVIEFRSFSVDKYLAGDLILVKV